MTDDGPRWLSDAGIDVDCNIEVGTKEGWRVWLVIGNLQSDTVKLAAAWRPFGEWPDERLEAACVPDCKRHPFMFWRRRPCRSKAPNPEHECGIHALKEREDVEAYARRYFSSPDAYTFKGLSARSHMGLAGAIGVVLGRIELWGDVLDCDDHWRGEFAYPQELFLIYGERAIADALSGRYRIPVTVSPIGSW